MSAEPASEGDPGNAALEDEVARAMDRVLQFERSAKEAVSACEKARDETLERARQDARAILERAQRRIVALHDRAARRLEERAAALRDERLKSAAAAVGVLADPAHRRAALERLTTRLTSDSPADDS